MRRWAKGTFIATVGTLLLLEAWLFWQVRLFLMAVALVVILILARRSDRVRFALIRGNSRPCGECDCPLVDHAPNHGACLRSSCPTNCDGYTN